MEQHAKKEPQKKAEQVAEAFVKASSFQTDPLGSYTGKTLDPYEKPVQDVDDL